MLEPMRIIDYMEFTYLSRETFLRNIHPLGVFVRRGTMLHREVVDLNFKWNWIHFADDFWTTLAEIIRASRVPHVGINSIFGTLHSSWRDAVSSVSHASINLTPGRIARRPPRRYPIRAWTDAVPLQGSSVRAPDTYEGMDVWVLCRSRENILPDDDLARQRLRRRRSRSGLVNYQA
ncbi:hypothetical protein CMUS01_03843 [Colletotrichum musicola]|uniref:Uncharacterized protein n=1 Tax=Colletotrichum musicola TaxID=2175873 RepID=A0A8H6U583_9PEZI|nr:hypothetical protein CMUS01_03843 [Colletotrichum musicola]